MRTGRPEGAAVAGDRTTLGMLRGRRLAAGRWQRTCREARAGGIFGAAAGGGARKIPPAIRLAMRGLAGEIALRVGEETSQRGMVVRVIGRH